MIKLLKKFEQNLLCKIVGNILKDIVQNKKMANK